MLKSKFSKKKNSFQAQKIFTDRIEPSEAFFESMHAFEEKQQEIVVFYGKGGIGKSTLLKRLNKYVDSENQNKKGGKIYGVFVSLDAYEYANPVNVLMSIRNGIHGDCSLFDYALMQYFAKTKMTIEELMNKGNMFSSPVMDIINDVINLSTAQVSIPSAALKKCITLIKDLRFKERYKEEIQEMEDFNEFDLFERLPYYLGVCISYAAEKGNYHVIFFDSYESLIVRTIGGTPSVDKEDWLKELFLASEQIRMVIASRDRLRWEREEPEWKFYLNQHFLENLSDEDSRWFLEQVPIKEEEIIDAIVEQSAGVPLYLDMSVDIYESNYNSGTEFDIEPLRNGEKIIDRYIRHLSKMDKYAIKVLSIPRNFDLSFAQQLLKEQNLAYSKDSLKELFEKSIVIEIDKQRGLYKIDESVRKHLYQKIDWAHKKDIFNDILLCIEKENHGNRFSYFATLIEMFIKEPDYLTGVTQRILSEIDFYANAGFWNELHSCLNDCVDAPDEMLHTFAVVEEMIWLRRTGHLNQAEDFAEKYPLKKEFLGIWYYMYQYMKVQIKHLKGYYDESICKYKMLVDEMNLIRTIIPAHIYNTICMKYADILFLKGNFSESLDIVEALLAMPDTPLVDQVELLRIKGHIFRFQKQYLQAEIIYRSIVEKIQESGLAAYNGKLYTNMTEVLCMTNPAEALEWYEKSLEENGRMGQDIELGKSQAAASAALTTMGNYHEGEFLAKQSIITAEKTGYKSGKAFALAALRYAYKSLGDKVKERETAQLLKNLLEEISVYLYIYTDEM